MAGQTTEAFGWEDGMSDCKEYKYVSDNSSDDFTHSVVKGDGVVRFCRGVVRAIWLLQDDCSPDTPGLGEII